MASELIHIIRQISADRGVDSEILFQAIESAMLAAAIKNMPTAKELRVELDRKTGEVHLYTQKTIVHAVTDDLNEVDRKTARKLVGPDADYDMAIEVEIPAQDLGRIAAQNVKQIVMQKIREAQRNNIFEEFKHRQGHIISGIVQRFDKEGVVLDIEHTEALLPFREIPKNHGYRQGDRLRCLCMEVKSFSKGPQILLSRTHPDLLRELFEQEVPEIADGVVNIESVSREAGDRAKIAVSCADKNVDPVGACVGMKGSRVQVIVRELKGEKVDIVPWSDDPAQFIANSLNPAKIIRVKIDPPNHRAIVVVDEDQLSLAIGKHGQNARLASKLTGWNLDIITEGEEFPQEEEFQEDENFQQEGENPENYETSEPEPEVREEKEV